MQSKYLESELSANVTPWIGLFETNRAYAWTDNSTVNFLPLSAENSKQGRYYFQDCFVISPTNQTGEFEPTVVLSIVKQTLSLYGTDV